MRRQRKREPEKVLNQRRWKGLWTMACDRARAVEDPRLALLERYSGNPEKILRKLSIISATDVDREFT